jgi:hypothetical protein
MEIGQINDSIQVIDLHLNLWMSLKFERLPRLK